MALLEGMDPKSGKFQKGNKCAKGRAKGSRNELTQRMLERFAIRNEDGVSVEDLLFDLLQSQKVSNELRFKAAAKLADMVFPKAQSVELEVESTDGMSMEEMDERIKQLMGDVGNVEAEDEDNEEDV